MIWQYVQLHWLEWLFTIITAILGFLYRDIRKRMKKEQQKNNAIADGVQSLLRESIVQNYNKYQDNEDMDCSVRKQIMNRTNRKKEGERLG